MGDKLEGLHAFVPWSSLRIMQGVETENRSVGPAIRKSLWVAVFLVVTYVLLGLLHRCLFLWDTDETYFSYTVGDDVYRELPLLEYSARAENLMMMHTSTMHVFRVLDFVYQYPLGSIEELLRQEPHEDTTVLTWLRDRSEKENLPRGTVVSWGALNAFRKTVFIEFSNQEQVFILGDLP